LEQAQRRAKEKAQVILCVQIYQTRYNEINKILARWLKELPGLQIAIDINRSSGPLPKEMDGVVGTNVQFATALLEWDFDLGRVVYRHVLPREYPLRLVNAKGAAIQGKSMNQVRRTRCNTFLVELLRHFLA